MRLKNLIILNYEGYDSLSDNVDNFTLKVIVKWRNHPNILASEQKDTANFSFGFIS